MKIYSAKTYFRKIKNLSASHTCIFSCRRMFGEYFSQEISDLFKKLGFSVDLYKIGVGNPHRIYSYIGIIDKGIVIYEDISDEAIEYTGKIGESEISVTSKCKFKGDVSEIIVAGNDHSMNLPGLNIVCYDFESNRLIDSISLDSRTKKSGERVSQKDLPYIENKNGNRNNWVVVTGAIRDVLEFYCILVYLCDLRSEGIFNGIVFSTWEDEIEKVEGLREKLSLLDIHVRETASVEEFNSRTAMSAFRQTLLLNRGLDYVPNDSFVLRCRTDLCLKHVGKFVDNIRKDIDLQTKSIGRFPVFFKYKVLVMRAHVLPLFFIEDFCFYGYKDDLKIMTTSVDFTWKYWNCSAETQIFGTLFISRFSPLLNFIRIFNLRNRARLRFKEYCSKNPMLDTIPDYFLECYAITLLVYYTHFRFLNNDTKIENVNLLDMFAKNHLLSNNYVIDETVNGRMASSATYTRLYRAIVSARDGNYHFELTDKKVKEMKSFFIEKLGLEKPLVDFQLYKNRSSRAIAKFPESESQKIVFDDFLDKKETVKICELVKADPNWIQNVKSLLEDISFGGKLYMTVIQCLVNSSDAHGIFVFCKLLDEAKVKSSEYAQCYSRTIQYLPRIMPTAGFCEESLWAFYHFIHYSEVNDVETCEKIIRYFVYVLFNGESNYLLDIRKGLTSDFSSYFILCIRAFLKESRDTLDKRVHRNRNVLLKYLYKFHIHQKYSHIEAIESIRDYSSHEELIRVLYMSDSTGVKE